MILRVRIVFILPLELTVHHWATHEASQHHLSTRYYLSGGWTWQCNMMVSKLDLCRVIELGHSLAFFKATDIALLFLKLQFKCLVGVFVHYSWQFGSVHQNTHDPVIPVLRIYPVKYPNILAKNGIQGYSPHHCFQQKYLKGTKCPSLADS